MSIFALAILLLSYSPVRADNLFADYGLGLLHSSGSQFLELRYEHNTSKLFGRPSFYDFMLDYWTNDFSAAGWGAARGIRWGTSEHSFSFALGFLALNHTTKHLGTKLQFHTRFAYNFRVAGSDLSVALTHISNGKLLFGWDGPNMGENFISFSVGFF